MDGFKAYKYYMAIKLHFTKDSFDVFKNRGNVKGTREAFNARNDSYLFEKLARKFPVDKDLIQFYVANFAYSNEYSLDSFSDSLDNLMEWTRRKQSITKIFSDDCSRILMYKHKEKLSEKQIFYFTNIQYPGILKMFLGKQISIESVAIMDSYMKLLENWKQNSSMLLLWENDIRRIEKLGGFIKFDKKKIEPVIKNFVDELKD
jgi:hypothetical protein